MTEKKARFKPKKDNFEIVGFFPLYGMKNKFIKFSAQVYFPSIDLDIRGFQVHWCKKGNSKVRMPFMCEYDHEDGKNRMFPVITSIDDSWMDKVKEELLKEAGKEFKKFKWKKGFPRTFKEYLHVRKGDVKKENSKDKKDGRR